MASIASFHQDAIHSWHNSESTLVPLVALLHATGNNTALQSIVLARSNVLRLKAKQPVLALNGATNFKVAEVTSEIEVNFVITHIARGQ